MELEKARLRRKEDITAKKKIEIEESRKRIEEYNKNKTEFGSQSSINKTEHEKDEKRKLFLEKAIKKKETRREASIVRNNSFRSVDNSDVKVEGPRSKKPTLAKSWRLDKSIQK